MKRALLVLWWQFAILATVSAYADVVTLKDGRQLSGSIQSGNTQEVRIQMEGRTEIVPVGQIQSIRFGSQQVVTPQPAPPTAPPATTPAAVPAPTKPIPEPAAPPSPAPSPAADSHTITLPAGTEIAVRTIERIDSKKADLSREYAGSLDDPILVGGVEVVPANANAVLKVVEVQRPGLTHRASLATVLVAVTIHGQKVKVETGRVDSKAGSQAKRTLTGTAAGAGTGAVVGAAAGGAAGAAIGAGVGAAAGTVVGKLAGKGVEIAPETRFTYKLTEPVVLSIEDAAK
jgi:uncharacterized protein YcfJ